MTRALHYAAAVWAVLFAAPHIWWALGYPFGFPGGQASHQLMFSTWRMVGDFVVIGLCVLVALAVLRQAIG